MFKVIDKKLIRFLFLILLTIIVSIFLAQNFVSTVFYAVILVLYSKSKDESFWLAYFFVTTDGFLGFLGPYSALLNILPGLPGIEISQIYIIIALYKIWKSRKDVKPFYSKWTILLFCYVIILVLVGLAHGLSGDLNLYFKIAKIILPLALFRSTPRLFKSIDQYAELFRLLFVVFIFAFFAQVFTVITGFSPAANFALKQQEELEVGRNLRTIYNPFISIVVLCGSLFFLSIKGQKYFSKSYLNIMAILCFGMAFLSATRGWMIAFTFIIFVFNVFINKLEFKNLMLVISLFVVIFAISLSFERINKQIMFSIERTLTLESLAKGDKTAEGTLVRLDERGPPVMEAWQQSPILGYGFSNIYFAKQDAHVGNLTLMLHSGVIGISLMIMFFVFVINKLRRLKIYQPNNPYKNGARVIIAVLLGWFFIHSTSGQHFAYFGIPGYIFPQGIVLALANFAVTYKA